MNLSIGSVESNKTWIFADKPGYFAKLQTKARGMINEKYLELFGKTLEVEDINRNYPARKYNNVL